MQTRLQLEKPEQRAGFSETWGSPTTIVILVGVTDASPQRVESMLNQKGSAQAGWSGFLLDRWDWKATMVSSKLPGVVGR